MFNSPSNICAYDIISEYYITLFFINIDIIISIITQKLGTREYVNNFLESLDALVSSSFYEFFLRNILLNNKVYLEKLIIVVNYILKPELYSLSSEEEFGKFINVHEGITEVSWEICNYNINTTNNFNINFSALKNVIPDLSLNQVLEFESLEDQKSIINNESVKMSNI